MSLCMQGGSTSLGALWKPKFWGPLTFTILNRERRYYSTSTFTKQIYSFFCVENKKQIPSSNKFNFINITKVIIDIQLSQYTNSQSYIINNGWYHLWRNEESEEEQEPKKNIHFTYFQNSALSRSSNVHIHKVFWLHQSKHKKLKIKNFNY